MVSSFLQENAHFSISESLIAAIELMKCNMMSQCLEEEEIEEEDGDREIQELKQKIRLRRQEIRTKSLLPAYQETEAGSECDPCVHACALCAHLFMASQSSGHVASHLCSLCAVF